jgi:hypothetical protein
LGNGFLEPLENTRRDHEFLEGGGKVVLHHFLSRIGFLAFAAMPGAMVVDVFLLLQFAHQTATAVPAPNESREGKVVFDPMLFRFASSIEQGLNGFPEFAAH